MASITPDRGWAWVVLISAFLCNVIFDGIIFSFGIFFLEFIDYFDAGRGRTSWIGSVISGTYAIVGPLASVLANKFGCRAVTIMGSLIAAAGFILSTFSPNIDVMILTFGFMGGFGFGLMYLCAYVMIGHFFEKHRAFATGLASCGSGVGTFIFNPISVTLIESFGWKGGMWIIAGIVLNGVVIGFTFRDISESKDEGEEEEVKENKKLIDFSLLKNTPFMVFCFSSFLCLIGFFVPFMYLPDFARKHGIGKEDGAFLVSIIGITNTVGRIICGYVSDKPWADALKIYNTALIIGGSVTMCAAWFDTYALLAVYAAIFGLAVAAYVSLCAIILVEFLGLEKLSNSFGFLNMFRGIATFIGAPVAGMLFDLTGDYEVAFYVAGAAIAAAGVICLPLRVFGKCEGATRAVNQFNKERAITLTDEELQELAVKLNLGPNTDSQNSKIPTLYNRMLMNASSTMSLELMDRNIARKVASKLSLTGSVSTLIASNPSMYIASTRSLQMKNSNPSPMIASNHSLQVDLNSHRLPENNHNKLENVQKVNVV